MEPRYLIITADDFGYSIERNQGIVECFKSGSISRASMLINGLQVINAIDISDQNMTIGLHLNLTEGTPISNPSKIKSLVNEAGFFHNRLYFLQHQHLFLVDEIELEITNQILKFVELMKGKYPMYVDGHQHVHITPVVIQAFLKVLKKFNINESRLPLELNALSYPWMDQYKNRDFYFKIINYCHEASLLFKENNIRYANFIGQSMMGDNMTLIRLQDAILNSYQKAATQTPSTNTERTSADVTDVNPISEPNHKITSHTNRTISKFCANATGQNTLTKNIINNSDTNAANHNKLVSYSNDPTLPSYINDTSRLDTKAANYNKSASCSNDPTLPSYINDTSSLDTNAANYNKSSSYNNDPTLTFYINDKSSLDIKAANYNKSASYSNDLTSTSYINDTTSYIIEPSQVLVTELMCHPGYPCLEATRGGCGEGADAFACSVERQHEMVILQSPQMKEFYRKHNIVVFS